ncbi:cytochrome c [Paenochrobactrum glaciei]|uniref:Cytochrome c n=1 Tax=Paenochrobactrum glaciei TaxID=486407 RepID=A0ABN1FX80_9HYPH
MKNISLLVRPLALAAAAATILGVAAPAALADSAGTGLSSSNTFAAQTGQELYETVCQACHMAEGKGAVGAGYYPALAKNETLAEASYPIYVLLNGLKGMPPVGQMMNDEQIAAVVTYIRTNFGNDYQEPVTAQDVADNR